MLQVKYSNTLNSPNKTTHKHNNEIRWAFHQHYRKDTVNIHTPDGTSVSIISAEPFSIDRVPNICNLKRQCMCKKQSQNALKKLWCCGCSWSLTGSLATENKRSPSLLYLIWVMDLSWPCRRMGFYRKHKAWVFSVHDLKGYSTFFWK